MLFPPSGSTLCCRALAGQAKVTVPPAAAAAGPGSKTSLVTSTVVLEPAARAVNWIGDPLTPLALARIVIVPAVEPSVTVVDAIPDASVAPEAGFTLPPPLTTVQVIVVPATGCPPVVTSTGRAEAGCAPVRPAWWSPSGAAFDSVGPPPPPGPVPSPPPQPSASAAITATVPKRCAGVTERHRVITGMLPPIARIPRGSGGGISKRGRQLPSPPAGGTPAPRYGLETALRVSVLNLHAAEMAENVPRSLSSGSSSIERNVSDRAGGRGEPARRTGRGKASPPPGPAGARRPAPSGWDRGRGGGAAAPRPR